MTSSPLQRSTYVMTPPSQPLRREVDACNERDSAGLSSEFVRGGVSFPRSTRGLWDSAVVGNQTVLHPSILLPQKCRIDLDVLNGVRDADRCLCVSRDSSGVVQFGTSNAPTSILHSASAFMGRLTVKDFDTLWERAYNELGRSPDVALFAVSEEVHSLLSIICFLLIRSKGARTSSE